PSYVEEFVRIGLLREPLNRWLIFRITYKAQKEADLPTKLPEIIKKPDWQRNFKDHDKTTRGGMTAIEAIERDELNSDL
ncbi:hypothetical protein GJ744_006416, partial [Endocarpon pusillum]